MKLAYWYWYLASRIPIRDVHLRLRDINRPNPDPPYFSCVFGVAWLSIDDQFNVETPIEHVTRTENARTISLDPLC